MKKDEAMILIAIAAAIPEMTEFEKGYFLGVAESKAADKRARKETPEPAVV